MAPVWSKKLKKSNILFIFSGLIAFLVSKNNPFTPFSLAKLTLHSGSQPVGRVARVPIYGHGRLDESWSPSSKIGT